MLSVARIVRSRGWFARRRDLIAAGATDAAIRGALSAGALVRVRHGWYALPNAPLAAVRVIRLGGRITGIAALRLHGLDVPRRPRIDVVVPAGACRLRSPTNATRPLLEADGITVHWTDPPRHTLDPNDWLASVDEALALVVATEPRDIAVACCSAALNKRRITPARLDRVFARAPARARAWRALVSAADESHGETFVRLWLGDAGIHCQSQVNVPGVGRVDFRVSPNVYIEVDGAQHDPNWTGETPSNWETDHDRDTSIAIDGGRTLRLTYRQLYSDWERCLAGVVRARNDDLELVARRRAQPRLPRGLARTLRRRPRRRAVERAVHPSLPRRAASRGSPLLRRGS